MSAPAKEQIVWAGQQKYQRELFGNNDVSLVFQIAIEVWSFG